MFAEYNDILCVADVCEILLIGRNSVYDLLNQGLLKGFRVGKSNWRIPKKSLTILLIHCQRLWVNLADLSKNASGNNPGGIYSITGYTT